MTTIFWHDTRHATRLLRMRPAFSWSVVITVALASGFLGVAASLATSLVSPYVEATQPVAAWFQHAELQALLPVAVVLLMAGTMVLVAAGANLATLSMSHYQSRLGEFAIRAGVGGTPRQLVRQLATEGVVLSGLACVLGGVVAFWTRQLIFASLTREQAATVEAGMTAGAVVAASTVSLAACAIVFVTCARTAAGLGLPLVPRDDENLAAAVRGMRPRRRLVVVQVATACALLVAVSLLPDGMNRALQAGPGVTAAEVAVVHTIAPTRYQDPARGRRFQLAALERVATLPGVTSVALTATLPLVSASRMGYADNPHGPFRPFGTIIVSSGYFATMQHPLIGGTEFDSRDDRVEGRVVINQQLAAAMFPGRPAGPHLYAEDGTRMTVIGVAANARYRQMERPVAPTVYLPLSSRYLSGFHLVARTGAEAQPRVAAIVTTLQAIDSTTIERQTTLDGHLRTAVRRDRVAMVFVNACGLLILIFAVSGPYLLTRQAVTTRYDELAVRLAFGAPGRHVFGLVMTQATRATAAGIAIGLAIAILLAAMAAGRTGVTAAAASLTALGVGSGLLVLCAIASAVPALRAFRLSPAAALR